MPQARPTLGYGILRGSLRNLLVSVLVPVVVAYSAGVAQSRSFISDIALVLLVLVALATGVLFVVHELLLIPLTLFQRHKFATMTAGDLTATFVSWVVLCDLFLGFLTFLLLPGDRGPLLGIAVLMAAGIYGAILYARSIVECVELAAPAEETEPAAPPQAELPAEAEPLPVLAPKRPALLGVRIYTAIVVAVPLMFAFWPPSWGVTLIVALVSFGTGRIVEALVIQWGQRRSE